MDGATAARLEALRNAATEAHRAGRREEARKLYAGYLAQMPRDAGMWSNLGALLRSEGFHDLARIAQERAYALSPKAPGVINNLANILNDIGEHARSLALREEALALKPDDANHKAMKGKSLRALGRYAEGIAFLRRATAEHPEDAELRIQLALTQLAAGQYAEGFRNYGARWQTGELTPRRMPMPKWDGGPLDGKRILVLPEQGFGDAVTFARFIPVLRHANPARVLVLCERPLARLMADVEGADWTGADMPAPAAFDVWTDMMDLPPLHFDRSETIPPPTRLTVPEDSRARARAIVAPHRDRFRVGVVWCGSLTYRANAFRSFSHRLFHRLLDIPDVQLFSLYKGPELAAFEADGSSALIIDAASTDRDFADCAATMEEMDLVITSCTATAHIAGSLGRPVWTLLHWDAFWLWQLDRHTSPWYPSMRLFRQTAPRDWDGVFARVRARLETRVAQWRKERAA
jgi:Flp pilus assembly protein TadD